MKKTISIILFLFCSILLVGCYFDTSKNDMDLIEVRVYGTDGNEVVGEYKNYYTELQEFIQYKKLSSKFKKLNSAAPVVDFYYLEVEENSSYTVEFVFYSKKKLELTSIRLKNVVDNSYYTCDNIAVEDDKFIAQYEFENINENYFALMVTDWYDASNTMHYFGESGGNTYIRGVFFNIKTKEAEA